MRQTPVIAWSGRADYVPPDLTGIAKQDPQGQLRVTPQRISKAQAKAMQEKLLADLGMGKW